ncbi:MAG: 4-hydroxy-3-methylbut-2-enyl diphosphate reductase [Anaerotardibacter sp.]
MKNLKIVLAKNAGACYGVQRALDMTYKAFETYGSVSTLGPLIHNPGVVRNLENLGISVAKSPEEATSKAIIIRSHGVVPQVIRNLEDKGLTVVDATCPHVMRAQKAAARLARDGYHVLVVGEAGHPEVEGISAHALEESGKCTIVGCPEDIPELLEEKIGIVVQTTQSREKLEQIVEALQNRGVNPVVKDTICSATTQRQEAASTLAHDADVMIVLGGRNSSNTTRLFELCSKQCQRVFHIETVDEIDSSWFKENEVVGISAGASTPEDQIKSVITYLESL